MEEPDLKTIDGGPEDRTPHTARVFLQLPVSQQRDPRLRPLARRLNTTMMLSSGEHDCMVEIQNGVVIEATAGPFVMPSYRFRIYADPEAWSGFLQPVPPPGYHDLLALVRRKTCRFEGDLHPLMAHLLFFKLLLATLRPEGGQP